jgi:hypothetical protein
VEETDLEVQDESQVAEIQDTPGNKDGMKIVRENMPGQSGPLVNFDV